MPARYRVVAASAAFALLLVIVAAGAGAAGGGDAATREREISELLVDKLGEDAQTIRVTVVDRKVILTGMVVERSTAELAKEVALIAPGVRKVDNQLVADKGQKLSAKKVETEARDSALETQVKAALVGEIGKHARKVEVEACDGWVSLRGRVPDQVRHELAMAAAKGVSGVQRVVDLMWVDE